MWRLLNGFEIRVRGWFVHLNAYGFGVGRDDPDGLGRNQFVLYRMGWKLKRG